MKYRARKLQKRSQRGIRGGGGGVIERRRETSERRIDWANVLACTVRGRTNRERERRKKWGGKKKNSNLVSKT